MLFLKIFTQVLTGISSILVIFLDYKWHDKRKITFKRLRNILMIVSIVSLVSGITITLIDDKTTQRTLTDIKSTGDTLKAQIKPFVELAMQRYPDISSEEALKKLKFRIEDLELKNNIIKTFDVFIHIEFSGKWNGEPYPTWLQPSGCEAYLIWDDKSKKKPNIEFCASRVNFTVVNESSGVFENTLSVQPGYYPISEMIDVLREYNHMYLWLPFIGAERFIQPFVRFDKIQMTFLVNGSKIGEINTNEGLIIDLSDAIKMHTKKTPYITPGFELNGPLVDLIGLKI